MSANNTDPKVIGKRVRAAREKFGWNQTELASRMGVRPNYVNRLEAGTMGNPSAERLAAWVCRVRDEMAADPSLRIAHMPREALAGGQLRDLAG